MSSDENVFVKAAKALSRLEEVALKGRDISEAVRSAQTTAHAAVHEMRTQTAESGGRINHAVRAIETARSELLTARAELQAAVERVRESEERAVATISRQVDLMRSEARLDARSMKRLLWIAVLVSVIGAGAGFIACFK